MVTHWTSDLKVSGLRPGFCCCVVSFDKKLYIVSQYPGVCNMNFAQIMSPQLAT